MNIDKFEEAIKQKLHKHSSSKGKKKKEEEEVEAKNDQFMNVDSDANIESYYNYCVEIVSFFYAVNPSKNIDFFSLF